MKNIIKGITILAFTGLLSSCEAWFDVESRSLITEEQAFSSKDGVTSVIANIYSRIPDSQEFNTAVMNDWDESIRCTDYATTDYGDGYRRYYDYGVIREINLFLENLEQYGRNLNPSDIKYFKAEGRFMRAYVYFQMVKNMGGVPLVLESFELKPGDTAETFQRPRETEVSMYEWISKEVDEIKDDLDVRQGNIPVKNRASKGAALAMKSRAMLYAASIAKYTATRTDLTLSLPGGEAGIPTSKADEYYNVSLAAAQELIGMNIYRLYNSNQNKAENFYETLIKKNAGNPESIFVKDYDGKNLKNNFTGSTVPRSLRSAASGGSAVGPTLNLVENYELIEGGLAPLKTVKGEETIEETKTLESSLDYVVYDKAEDIFAGRDPRLSGTILTPGSSFRGKDLQLWAGIAVWDNGKYIFKQVTKIEDVESTQDALKNYNGRQMTGSDGPHFTSNDVTNTGFLLRKYVDTKPGSELDGGSDLAFVRFRYAEVLLNAAEAAYELGQKDVALDYLNEIRVRAGIKKLEAITSIDQIRHERMVELAFEDHRFYDVKRWRIGDRIFDGNANTSTALICGLWPYKVYRPGHADDGKWIFRRVRANKRNYPVKFINGNYYSSFNNEDLSRNKLLVKNPYQV